MDGYITVNSTKHPIIKTIKSNIKKKIKSNYRDSHDQYADYGQ